jgi:hypothetical protein
MNETPFDVDSVVLTVAALQARLDAFAPHMPVMVAGNGHLAAVVHAMVENTQVTGPVCVLYVLEPEPAAESSTLPGDQPLPFPDREPTP